MKSYIYPMVLEECEGKWCAHVPGLEERGAATWGDTRDEAIRNMNEVAQMIIEILIEDQEPLPETIKIENSSLGVVVV